jgi:polyhydroxyalkanoate synthesis regulator phasin
MPTNRKLLGAAAFSLALAGGGVAGAVLGTPSLSGAQDDTTSTTQGSIATEDVGGRHLGGPGARLATAAEALGITEDELRTALEGGQSIAQVAEAEGVDVQTVVDALVAEATARLSELEASLPERMTELVNREGLPERHGPGGLGLPGGHHGRHLLGAGLDAAAEAIGITDDELRTALEGGQSIAEVAEANDVDVQTVIDALVAAATEHIDQAVTDGRIDADRAEELKADLTERITARVNGEAPLRGERGFEAPMADDAD